MRMLNNGQLNVKIVEDYSIDREDKSKYSVFVLEKHFIIDPSYHIVSVYDNQLSKSKDINVSRLQIALAAFNYVYNNYSNEVSPLEIEIVFDKVDFRYDQNFRELVRQVVDSDNDFQKMLNGEVRSTQFMEAASGKIEVFEIQGTCYSIIFNRYMNEDIRINIQVNGHEYDWESPDYLSSPLYPDEEDDY